MFAGFPHEANAFLERRVGDVTGSARRRLPVVGLEFKGGHRGRGDQGGVRRAEEGRPGVPPQARPVPRALPRPRRGEERLRPLQQSFDKAHAWAVFHRQLGLGPKVAVGDRVSAALEPLPRIEGVVDYVNDDFLGVLASDGLYRFIHGHDGSVVVEHHIFSDHLARRESPEAWRAWLEKAFAS